MTSPHHQNHNHLTMKKRKRSDWRKKNPAALKRLIAAMKKSHSTAAYRKRLSLKMKQVYAEHPEYGKELSKLRKLQYLKEPGYRKKISVAMKKVFREHPNLKTEFKQNFLKFLKSNPNFIINFNKSRGNPNKLDVKTMKGGFVRSSYEKEVANTLFVNHINYMYESKMRIFEKEARWAIPDFWLPDYKIYIEVFGGYYGSAKIAREVRAKARWKRKFYKKYHIRCLYLTPGKMLDLKASLLEKL